MGLTWNQAKAIGLEAYWPTETKRPPVVVPPPPKSKATDDGMNKLERSLWGRMQEAKRAQLFLECWREPFKLRVINNRYYIPDFVTHDCFNNQITIWEAKGFMREDASLKLLAAAERYSCFRWVLVQRDRGKWRCIDVTPRGYGKTEWCPDWLR